MQRVDELTAPPIVGKMYLVPCVEETLLGALWRNVPIVGHAHSDPELGAPFEHFHYDLRFFSDRMIAGHARRLGTSVLATPLIGDLDIRYLRRKCRRKMPVFGSSSAKYGESPLRDVLVINHFRRRVEAICPGRRMMSWICPHRGANLASCEVVNGVVECPLHGLRFRVDTGEMVVAE